ncbi:protein SRC2-like [Macadamia integrifolia]|uniref:protein SRC2-like n=1 Tax=Macadamia integrifolia TaxID=60698 RepID=UPI001C52B7B6|nr:protein SRC2-like [Macadamia integrifolia]
MAYDYHPLRTPMELKVTISSSKDIKNVNWRHGPLKPYAVVWVDPKTKLSTPVDHYGDTCPNWDKTLVIPLTVPIDEATLYIDIVQADAAEDTKPLIGSARVPLREIVDEVGVGESACRSLQLRRPSGRPHGKLEAKFVVVDTRYRAPDPYYTPSYGVPPPPASASSRDYSAPYGYPYATPSPYAAAPPPQGEYAPAYGQQSAYGQQPEYGYGGGAVEEKKKSKFGGMGMGLAVGAVGGLLGGLALAEGAEYLEDKIADNVAEKVEDDLGYNNDFRGGDDDGDGGFGGDDF